MGAALRKWKNASLETCSLIWLDATVNECQENINVQNQLRKLVYYFKMFTNCEECEQYIRSASIHNHIILVVSGHLGQVIVPRIHQIQQISSIYVYCMDKAKNEQWSSHYKKVRLILRRPQD